MSRSFGHPFIHLLLFVGLIVGFVLAAPSEGTAQPARDPDAQLDVHATAVEAGEVFAITASHCPGGAYRPVGEYRAEVVVTFVSDAQPSREYREVVSFASNGGDTWTSLVSVPQDGPTVGGVYEVTGSCYFTDSVEYEWFTYEPQTFEVRPPATPIFSAPARLAAGETFDLVATTCPATAAANGGRDADLKVVISHDAPDGVAAQAVQTVMVPGANGMHEAAITIPTIAPTIGGWYDVVTYCDAADVEPGYRDVRLRVAPEMKPECDGRSATVDLSMLDEPTEFGDIIVGTSGIDHIDGRGGVDIICGLGGADRLAGGSGDDVIYGGGGHDVIAGGIGDDIIYGQGGGDVLRGGVGEDRLLGGPGFDKLHGDDGDDFMQGSGGDDELWGGDGRDRLYGKTGDDQLFGGSGDDQLFAAHGDDRAWGEDGNDRIQGASGDDWIEGGNGNDVIYGQADDDELYGNAGDDTIYAAAGDDLLVGGLGNDDLQGANGHDVLDGGPGDDVLYGQAGDDDLDGGADRNACWAGAPSENDRVVNC